ncbi:glyoxylate/hydroxypyruvate reductase [Salix suchowensis]|nr:glyoxylate/hydroxypyruvate reductase [Salix suchowensis]
MAVEANQEWLKSNGDPHLVLVHRLPSFNFQLKDILQPHFHLLDPAGSPEPAGSFLSSHAQSVRALICVANTPLTAETLSLLPSLELECRRRGIILTNASTAFAEDAADYAVTLLIDVCRRISAADRFLHAGLWPVKGGYYPLGSKLGGKRVGIVGLGSIGFEVSKRLEAFGCSIAYSSRKEKPHVPYAYHANVLDLAAHSDALVLCCSLSEQTRHIINKDVMTALGKKGVVINVGRGGDIGGAGLDVFEDEPDVPPQLFELDNVVLSPHRAIFTPEAIEALNQLTFTNLKAFFSNKPLQSVYQIE